MNQLEKYKPEYNEVPIMDLRIVDNIERKDRWKNKAMEKFFSLTESLSDHNTRGNCPSGIPNHNCPRSKEITVNRSYTNDEYDREFVRHIIRKPQFIEELNYGDLPHPSNHEI